MALNFEMGDKDHPKGHALVYFWSNTKVYASYVMVLPWEFDIKRYVPPFLSAQAGQVEMSLIAFPPAPEEVKSKQFILNLAKVRGDDVIDGGLVSSLDTTDTMAKLGSIGREYAEECKRLGASYKALESGKDLELQQGSIDTLFYDTLSPQDRLAKLSSLLGKFIYAKGGGNTAELLRIEDEIKSLAKTFGENYKLGMLIKYGKMQTEDAKVVAELYLERAYKLQSEDYLRVQEIENKLKVMQKNLEESH